MSGAVQGPWRQVAMSRDTLRCWHVYDIWTREDSMLILERTRGRALSIWADAHDMLFDECVSKGTTVRVNRVPELDGYSDVCGDIFENGPYVFYLNCSTDCARCDRYILRQPEEGEEEGQAIVLGQWAYCLPCAYQIVTGEEYGRVSEHDMDGLLRDDSGGAGVEVDSVSDPAVDREAEEAKE